MIILDTALARRAADGKPVRIGIVGAGYMARGILAHATLLAGVEVVAVSNRTSDRAEAILVEVTGVKPTRVTTVKELDAAVAAGACAVSDDPALICASAAVDVVIEATGEVEFGANVVLDAIAHGKHVVLVNAELDGTVGPILKTKASEAGVVLSNTDGDEPGVTMNLVRYVAAIGLQPVLAGNVKGFIDVHRTPETQSAFAESVGQGPRMITSFADGTKLSLEATLVANATGFSVAQRGMSGLRCDHVRDVVGLYDPDELRNGGIVDYVLGAEPGSGAFVVGWSDNPVAAQYLKYFKMGDGPLYLFYTPWHLPQAEAPLTAARAALFHDASVTPLGAPSCDVITIAKRDLRAGDVLDGIGGFTCYGTIENAAVSRREQLLPMGLTEGCRLLVDVPADSPIRSADIALPPGRLIDRLRAEQDAMFAPQ